MVILVVALAVLLVAAIVALRLKTRQRQQGTKRLQGQFGSEYSSAVSGAGRKKGEAELEKRQDRVGAFDLHPLSAAESERYTGLWTATQARFVDDPGGAIADADRLLSEVMQSRGYPVSDFEQRASDISVNHPEFVANYRAGHAQAVRHSHGETSTEDLRQAMIHYRWLFTDLVARDEAVAAAAPA